MRPELIALVAALVAVPGIIVTLIAVHRREVAARLEAAERLGLAYARDREGAWHGAVLGRIRVDGRDRLVGSWRGRNARVDFARESHGNHGSSHFTRAVVEGLPSGLHLLVRRETVASRLGEAMGLVKDLKTGDDAVDRTWRIQGKPEGAVIALLRQPGFRAVLERDREATAVIVKMSSSGSRSSARGAWSFSSAGPCAIPSACVPCWTWRPTSPTPFPHGDPAACPGRDSPVRFCHRQG